MANISDLLNKIKSARYGRDVRDSIHDAIQAMNTDIENNVTAVQNLTERAESASSSAKTYSTDASAAATNAKNYSNSAKQYSESAASAIARAYDTEVTAEKRIANTIEASMLVTKATMNLLKPNLQTTTQNGVICTNNGDGTYTLNGTATSEAVFGFLTSEGVKLLYNNAVGKTLKFLDGGFCHGASGRCLLNIKNDNGSWWSKGEQYTESVFTVIEGYSSIYIDIRIPKGATLSNVLVKPMLTTDLDATNDDFVSYSGYDIKTCGKNIVGNPSNLNSPTVKDGVVTFPAKSAATNDAYLRLYTDVDLSAFDTFRVVVESINCTINDGNKSYVLIKTAGKKEFSTLTATSFESSANKYVSNVFNCSDFGNKIAEITVIVKKGYAYPGGSYKISVFNGEVKEFSSWVKYVESSVHIDSSTEFPLLGLKSFNGETNIISLGNVEVSHALTDTGKYVMQNMKDISDIKAAIVASGSTTE